MRNKRLFSFIFILGLLSSCQPQGRTSAASASASGGAAASSDYIFGGWTAGRLPLQVSISSDFTSTERDRLVSVSNKWETAGGKNFITFNAASVSNKDLASMNSYLDGRIEVHQVNTSALPSSSLAVTVFNGIVLNSGTSDEYVRINDADILFNYNDFVFNTNPSIGEWDLESVMIHEVGHLLGMSHISASSKVSVMNPTISSGAKIRTLFDIDKANIKSNYGTSSSSLSFAVSGGASNEPEAPEEGEFVSGYFELSADKTCTHVINGKVVHQHKR